MYDVILHDCVSKDVMCSYLQSLSDLNALAELQCMYLHKVKECDSLAQKLSKQTEHVSKKVHTKLLQRFAKLEQHLISLELDLKRCKEQVKNDTVCNEKASNVFRKEREQYFKIQDLKAQMQDKNIAISELMKLIEQGKGKSIDTKFDRPSVVRQPNAQRIPKPSVLGKPTPFLDSLERRYFPKTRSVLKTNVSEGVNHKPNVSRPQLKSNQSRDKVLPNNSEMKVKKTQVEVHPRIPSVSNKIKSVTTCKDSLNSRTLKANAICATCNKCLVDSNHFACVTKMLNDVHARTKKHNIVQLILFIVDSGCTKHMTGNLKLLCNFVEKFLGTVRFGNDQFVPIIGYGDLVQGNVTINRVYYVKGLNHNLFSVGQFCDADLEVAFRKSICFVRDLQGKDLLTGKHGSDLYMISLQESTSSTPLCLMAKATPTQAWLWHRMLSHLNFDYINLLSKKDIVIVLPKFKYVKDQLCSSCELSKANRSSFKSKVVPSSKGRLNLLHMGLCGPMRVSSINGKKYIMVIIDDYSRYTWTLFLRSKDETPETLNAFFKEEGIENQTSIARTPEQNGIVKRRNHTLVEAARMMLSASQLSLFFWAEAIATACYTQNRFIIILTHDKTPYHIINDRKPSIKHLHIFGCICYITRDGKNLDKMKEKGDQCILVGYSTQSNGYLVYNKRTRMIVESIHIRFDEIKEVSETSVANNTSGLDNEFTNPFCAPAQEEAETSSYNNGTSNVPTFNQPHVFEYRWTKDHPLEQVHGNPSRPVQTRRQLATDPEMCMFALTVSTVEPKNIKEVMADSAWIEAMQEELHQFDRLQAWKLVDKPYGLKNHSLQLYAWKLFGFLLLMQHTNGFVDPYHPEKVYRLRKALYGLKQAPRAWYDELSKFLTSKGFTKGIQIHQSPSGIFINQDKYTLEILHKHGMDKGQSIGTPMATKPKLDTDLSGNPVDQTEYRSKIGSLMYLTSSRPDIVQSVCFCARYQSQPTEKHLKEVKRIFRYLRGTVNMGLRYPKDSSFKLTAFSDADHGGCIDSRKSTSGGIQFLGDKLVSWMSKKHNCTAMSSVEAEYMALSASCAQVMWMRTQLQDYGFNYNKIPLYCDSQLAIAISCNPVHHSRTKHIHTRYHFIKEQVKNGIIELYFVRTEYQLADMFIKALPEDRFKYLVRRIGMRCLTPAELEVMAKESA
uniref:Retrovirus-related Pol polyprotein from transposon TNT 1-94 n=1 Tax=Tanacetum cinerariifolium TaxID=118510 RepID=A0A699HSS3_TANCI|nr:retrovirus-related Pol polyprotein from transposon TNT 1-94 [Tanacetum cinerariifolium]